MASSLYTARDDRAVAGSARDVAPAGSTGPAVRVVLFSDDRGSGFLAKQLLKDSHIRLTLAINGDDDDASTGEVRRLLGGSLGPSDSSREHIAAIGPVRQRASIAPAVVDRVEACLG